MIDPREVEFLAEKKFISIVPNFSHPIMHLITGPIGPFRAGLPLKVPIWLALNLKKQQKCRILPMEWMNMESLEEIKEVEKSARYFTPMPSDHYMEEAQMILSAAPDDIPDIDNIRTAIKDIWDLRIAKLRTDVLGFISTGGTYAGFNHLTSMEMLSARPLLPDALDTMRYLEHPESAHSAKFMLQDD